MVKKWVYLLVLSLIWGSSFILIKKALVGFTPLQVGALRIVVASFFLLTIGFRRIASIGRVDWKWIILSGFLGSFLPPFLFALAQSEIDSSIASILNSLTPLNTVVSGILMFGVLVTKRQLLGVFIGLFGTLILIFTSMQLNPSQNFLYSLFIVVASIGYAFNINILNRYLRHLPAVGIAVGNFVSVAFPALVLLFFSGFFDLKFSETHVQLSLLYVSLLAVFGTGIALILFNKLIQSASPVFASSVTYTMTVIAVLWGVIDGETLNFLQLLGGAIIILGVFLTHKKTPQ